MTTPNPMLAPVVALAAWTLVMWLWMYATRIPAITRARMRLDPDAPRGEQMAQLLALAGDSSTLSVGLAWAFVGLRVLHSLWQALFNVIMVRFALFVLSTLPLFGLTWRAAHAVL
jgi:hypothetical protein